MEQEVTVCVSGQCGVSVDSHILGLLYCLHPQVPTVGWAGGQAGQSWGLCTPILPAFSDRISVHSQSPDIIFQIDVSSF